MREYVRPGVDVPTPGTEVEWSYGKGYARGTVLFVEQKRTGRWVASVEWRSRSQYRVITRDVRELGWATKREGADQ
jgi:hypothetical protein